MIKIHRLILFSALLQIIPSTAKATPVLPSHEIYPFLERMNIKYDLNLFMGTRPLHKHEIIAALKQLEDYSTELTQWERKRFHYFRRLFLTTLKQQDSWLVYQNGQKELMGSVNHSTDIRYLDSVPTPQLFAFGTVGIDVEGQLDSSLSFTSHITFAQERTTEPQFSGHYYANMGLPYNTPDNSSSNDSLFEVSTFDGYRTLVSWRKNNITLDFGNDWNQWGAGSWQHPTVAQDSWFWTSDSAETRRAWEQSQNINTDSMSPMAVDSISNLFPWRGRRRGYTRLAENTPITQIRGTIQWDMLRYTKFFGERTGLHYDSSSYLVGHRLETHIGNFTVGIHEILTYSRNELEFGYMIPFVSLFMTEHFMGDRDNIAMGIDIQFTFLHKFRIYAELFLDDLVGPGRFFDDYYGNKTAPLAGIDIYDLYMPYTVLKLEYARVDPWVYSHVSGKNQFQNLGSLTGSRLPPNSHSIRLQLTKHFLSGIDLRVDYLFFQHQNLDEGSSLFDTRPLSGNTRKNFLGKDPETLQEISSKVRYQWDRYITLSGLLGYSYISNWRSNPGKNYDRLKWELMWQLVY